MTGIDGVRASLVFAIPMLRLHPQSQDGEPPATMPIETIRIDTTVTYPAGIDMDKVAFVLHEYYGSVEAVLIRELFKSKRGD